MDKHQRIILMFVLMLVIFGLIVVSAFLPAGAVAKPFLQLLISIFSFINMVLGIKEKNTPIIILYGLQFYLSFFLSIYGFIHLTTM